MLPLELIRHIYSFLYRAALQRRVLTAEGIAAWRDLQNFEEVFPVAPFDFFSRGSEE